MSRYDGPILDSHQHFWEPDRNPHPWLRPGVRIPFRYGDYEAIKRRYLPDDYRRDAGPHPIVASVYVETEWEPTDPLGETAYAAGLAAAWGLPNAIVAQAWLDRDDVAEVLAGQAACPLVRSVRHKPGGPQAPDAVGRCRTLMSDERWRTGYALLRRHGLRFDLQTPWWNLDEAVDLARDFPGTPIILNHAGLPSRRDPGSLAAWRAAMARFAACPNAAVKASGLGQPGRAWTPESNGPVVRTLIDLFGADRVMFGSNFPVDSLCADLAPMIDGFRTIVAPLPDAEQEAFFIGTARRIYGLAAAGS
ncbi:amidohydrolase family protein [Methylobacterium sp. JK268]